MVFHLQARLRYERMLASSATAAICASAEHLIVSWNTAAEKLFGHSAESAIGKPLSIIIPSAKHADHAMGFNRAVRTSRTKLTGKSVEVFAVHADGHEIPVELSVSMWFEGGTPMFGALVQDISDRHIAQQRLQDIAHRDAVTSLPNRYAMQQKIAEEIPRAPCSLLLLDLDDFKQVNDTLGHSVGDELLAAVSHRLVAAVGDVGYVSRLGGDEFAILMPGCANPLDVDDLTKNIFDALNSPFDLAGQSIFVCTSIGIAMAPTDATNPQHLLSSADLALYNAKNDGGGKRKFFTRALQSGAEQKRLLGADLRTALANNEFEIWYQPQFSITDYQLTGVEALLRWRHPIHGLLSPQIFMDVLDKSVIAEEVGNWVINEVCATAAYWKGIAPKPLRFAVNLFSAQLCTGRLFKTVTKALRRHGTQAEELELEITENTVLRHSKNGIQHLAKLKDLGVGIAFDDFGTGYASLSILQKFPLTRIKIDRTFITGIDKNSGDEAIVTAIVTMAKSLGLAVIAEGVETVEQEAVVKRTGCTEVQGHLYGRAIAADEFFAVWFIGDGSDQTKRASTAIL